MTAWSRIFAACWVGVGLPAIFPAILEHGSMSDPDPPYNPATEFRDMVTVVDSREVPQSTALAGVHLSVRIGAEITDVFLAPSDFLKEFEIRFNKGDRIELTGSKVKSESATVVLAREVRKGGTTLYLRNAKGQPNWKTKPQPASHSRFGRKSIWIAQHRAAEWETGMFAGRLQVATHQWLIIGAGPGIDRAARG